MPAAPGADSRSGVIGGAFSVLGSFLGRPEYVAGLLGLFLFLTTVQTGINGSADAYATDVGEIQNALPRWGTLHFTGYPQYTALGSAFVTLLRFIGIEPALGASLYSAMWGALSIGLLVALMRRLKIRSGIAIVCALLYALSLSMWIDASIAELHTMTMALMFAILLAALHYHQTKQTTSLYWLALLSGHGFTHQRSVAFMGLGLLVLMLPHWREILRRWPKLLVLALSGPLTYLYLPLRAWMGADWVFSAPGTWTGFWTIVLDTKAERIVSFPSALAGWLERAAIINDLLREDWPWVLLLIGLAALIFFGTSISRRERLALTLTWVAFYGMSLIIWEGRISDALLAIKMPVVAMAAVGLGLLTQTVWAQRANLGRLSLALWAASAIWLFLSHRPLVREITHDPSAYETITTASAALAVAEEAPVTLMALWGNDYWQVVYAQAFQGRLTDINIVDHNANFRAIVARGDRLLVLSRTFYQRSVSWWEDRLQSDVYLGAPVPGLIEVTVNPKRDAPEADFLLDNGIGISDAQVNWHDADTLWIRMAWIAPETPTEDYSVAVHLLSRESSQGAANIVAQADRAHPVDGWYPVSHWLPGEIVADAYALAVPAGSDPAAVRIGMYQVSAAGEFLNTNWMTLTVPPRTE